MLKSIFVSYIVLLLTSGLSFYFYVIKHDALHFATSTFLLTFLYAVLSFYANIKQFYGEMLIRMTHTSKFLVSVIALPFLTTELFIKYEVYSIGNYFPAVLGATLASRYIIENSSSQIANDVNLYTCTAGILINCYTNFAAILAAFVFLIAELLYEDDHDPLEQSGIVLHNLFLSLFCYSAYLSLPCDIQ